MHSQSCSEYSIQSSMPSLPKTNCAFHSSEPITNFCTCESCLLPLCPSCVKIHTIEHINLKKVNPTYEPINDLMGEIYD